MHLTAAEVTGLKGCLREYLQGLGVNPRRRFRCLSPHHEDRNPSMSYSVRGEYVHCFSCGATYDIFDLVGMEYGLQGFREQAEKVCELYGRLPAAVPSISKGRRAQDEEPGENSFDYSRALDQLRAQSDGDRSYFYSRGLTDETCDRYGLFTAGARAYFPIFENGICCGWSGRAVEERTAPRYQNSQGPLGLWNGDLLEHGQQEWICVTEGIIDALCLEQMGYPSVALCGSQNTGKLLRRCQNLAADRRCRFLLCGDPDEAGQRMNGHLAEHLEAGGFSCAVLPLQEEDGDVGQLYLNNRDRLLALIQEAGTAAVVPASCMADFVDGFFAKYVQGPGVKPTATGFAKLDRLLDGGLYPGLYVVGAISSIGKTSFALQLADQISQRGEDVLFLSLEQSREELIAKSLSRLSFQMNGEKQNQALSARSILRGQAEGGAKRISRLDEIGAAYQQIAARLFVREGWSGVGVEQVCEAVKQHRDRYGSPPIVIVDYLQILAPADLRATDKQNTDRAVVSLKRLSRDYDIPVIAISSFNRENYRAAVSMESFKESGAVEYSSDVLLGLQLKGAGNKSFDVNKEKNRNPRSIELVLLKNRSGIPYGKIHLKYFAKYNLFCEAEEEKQPEKGFF